MIKRLLSSSIAAALILLSPGLAPYQALAAGKQGQAGRGPAGQTPAPVPMQTLLIKGPTVGANLFPAGIKIALPDAPAEIPPGHKAALVPTYYTPGNATLHQRIEIVPGSPAPAPAVRHERRQAPSLSAAAESADAVFKDAGDISRADTGRVFQTGHDLNAALTGVRFLRYDDGAYVPAGGEFFGAFPAGSDNDSQVYGRAAGEESIAPAVRANYRGPTDPPAPPDDGDNGGNGGGNDGNDSNGERPGSRAPLIPRIVASLVIASPAVLLGWPLIAAGSVVSGLAVIAASLGVAAYPFMSVRTPVFLRSLPAAAVIGSGAVLLASLAAAFAWPAAVMGGLTVLGGWGLLRFARDQKKWSGTSDIGLMLTSLGASSAALGVGVALLSPAGWTAALIYPAMIATAFLMMHLPGWVGQGIETAVRGARYAFEDIFRAAYSHWTDTPLRKRLTNWTEAAVKASAWSAFPIGLLVWLPVLAVEIVRGMAALSLALAASAARAIPSFLWGASHKLAPKSWPTRLFAEWARAQAAVSKSAVLNVMTRPLIPLTESSSWLVRQIGGALVAGAQLVFAAITAAWTVLGLPLGLAIGFFGSFGSYDAARHDPAKLALADDPLEGAYKNPAEPVVTGGAWLSRLLSAGVGLAPVYFFGLPLFAYRPYLGGAYIAAAALVALMPLHPRGAWFPGFARRLPALALLAAGLFAFGSGDSLLYGAVAVASALGLSRLIDKILQRDAEGGKAWYWKVTGARYILGFAAALAVAAGLGADLAGEFWFSEEPGWDDLTWGNAAGVAGLALSTVLLYHLGKPFWIGIWTGLRGYWYNLYAAAKVFLAWGDDERLKFGENVSDWFGYWNKKSGWNWMWLFVPGAFGLAAVVAYAALTLVVGLFLGTLHFTPLAFWGSAYARNPDARWTRFWSGFARSLLTTQSGSETWFKWFVNPLKPWLDARVEKKDGRGDDLIAPRPAFKAWLAAIPFALSQLLWLAAVALSTTVWVGVALYFGAPLYLAGLLAAPAAYYLGKAFVDGVRNAWGAKTKAEDKHSDPDRPGNALKN